MVVPVVGDFAGPKAIRAVGQYLEQRGAIVTAFYVSNVEQYLFGTPSTNQRFYRSVGALPIDSTSAFIRSLPGGASIIGFPPDFNPTAYTRLLVADSAGVRILTASWTDSAGQPATRRFVTAIPAMSTVAFVSGIAPIRRTLDAFADGRLKSYAEVMALTKTDGWGQPPR